VLRNINIQGTLEVLDLQVEAAYRLARIQLLVPN
jgi:hypothetical protein